MRTARRRITALFTALALALGLMLAVAPAASAGTNGQQVAGYAWPVTQMTVCGNNQRGVLRCGTANSLGDMPIRLYGYWFVGPISYQFCTGWWCRGWQYSNVPLQHATDWWYVS